MSKVIGVIPSRYGSTRFEGKPLAQIRNQNQTKEMILWVIEAAKTAKSLTDVIVATDDQRIADVVQKQGHKFAMTESSLQSGTDRIYQAVKDIECDIVVNIQGDEPLIHPSMIDAVVVPLIKNPHYAMSTLAHKISKEELHSTHSVKVLINELGEAIYFTRFPVPFSRMGEQDLKTQKSVYKHVGIYAYRKDFLRKFCEWPPAFIEQAESLEQLRALHAGVIIKVELTEHQIQGVDVPEDIQKIEEILNRGQK